MASASSSRNPAPDPGYYEEYSDPEMDPPAGTNGHSHNEEDDDEDEDEPDFVPQKRRKSSPEPIPYQPPPTNDLKRKASDAGPPHPPRNGGPVDSKRPRPEPLEPSILCAEPLDEFVLEIADWVHKHAQGRSNIEVEAKVGMILDTRTKERVNLPVLNETILAPEYPEIQFESNMTVQQHHTYNTMLNRLVERTKPPGYPHARINYEHTKVVDTFYAAGGQKVRLSTDEKTGKVKECVQKTRIADLNVYSPKRKLDWRVSVSTEIPVPLPPTGGTPSNIRRKDRVSYAHQSFKIDLTQVTTAGQGSDGLRHELEIEFADSTELMNLARVRTRGSPWTGKDGEGFDELMRVFVNNIRILVRNAGD